MRAKKRRLKKWVLYVLFMALTLVFMGLCERLGLIKVVDTQTVDITYIIMIISVYEVIRKIVKIIVKREEKDAYFEEKNI